MGIYTDYFISVASKTNATNTQDPVLNYLEQLGHHSATRPFDTKTMTSEKNGAAVASALAAAASAIALLDKEVTFPISDEKIQRIVFCFWTFSDPIVKDIQQYANDKKLALSATHLFGVTEAARNFIFNTLHSIVMIKKPDGKVAYNYPKLIFYNDILNKLIPKPAGSDYLSHNVLSDVHKEELTYIKDKFLVSSLEKMLAAIHIFGTRHFFNLLDEIIKTDTQIVDNIAKQLATFNVLANSPEAAQLNQLNKALNQYKKNGALAATDIADVDYLFKNVHEPVRRDPNMRWLSSRSSSLNYLPYTSSATPPTRASSVKALPVQDAAINMISAPDISLLPRTRPRANAFTMYAAKPEQMNQNIAVPSENDLTELLTKLVTLLENLVYPATQCKNKDLTNYLPPQKFNIIADEILKLRLEYKDTLSQDNFIHLLHSLEIKLSECKKDERLTPLTVVLQTGLNAVLQPFLKGANTHRTVINKLAEMYGKALGQPTYLVPSA